MNTSAGSKLPFDAKNANLNIVRQIVIERLRREDWHHLDKSGDGFSPYVEYAGPDINHRHILCFLAQEVFWQLVVEGILAPGYDSYSLDLPWFHVTQFGREVLASVELQPYDPTDYLKRVRERIVNPDPTVMAYLAESLDTFHKGSRVASTVMLGIAAERVFLLICESLVTALASVSEKAAFTKLLSRFAMKPKLDWVQIKVEQIQKRGQSDFPDNATIMIVTIYDLMRAQRNDLGHPREAPPNLKRGDAFVNLQIFPRYYETAEAVRAFLVSNSV